VEITQAKMELDYIKAVPGVDCDVMNEMMGSVDLSKMAMFEYQEFKDNYPNGAWSVFDLETTISDRLPKSGYLSCYCGS
jgi:hypothetical protein